MVYIHLADGFEEVEALTVVDILRRGGLDVKTVSINATTEVTGAHGIKVIADILFNEADYDNCRMIILPGGMPGAANLQAFAPLGEQIVRFAKECRPIAAICAAPMILAHYHVFKGEKATIYPGMENLLIGAEHTPVGAITDGNITTGQGPAKAMEFALEVLSVLEGKDKAAVVAAGCLY